MQSDRAFSGLVGRLTAEDFIETPVVETAPPAVKEIILPLAEIEPAVPAPTKKKLGRPRKYANDAARQKAHRDKVRLERESRQVIHEHYDWKGGEKETAYDVVKIGRMREKSEECEGGRRVTPRGASPDPKKMGRSKRDQREQEDTFVNRYFRNLTPDTRSVAQIKHIAASRMLCSEHTQDPPAGVAGSWDMTPEGKRFLFHAHWNKRKGMIDLSCGCCRALCIRCRTPVALSGGGPKCKCQ
jgi:hypothetical protein